VSGKPLREGLVSVNGEVKMLRENESVDKEAEKRCDFQDIYSIDG
jgi:hypothetical protein